MEGSTNNDSVERQLKFKTSDASPNLGTYFWQTLDNPFNFSCLTTHWIEEFLKYYFNLSL